MHVVDLSIQGPKIVIPKVFFDERGFFKESYRKPLYEENGITCDFVQDNHSFSKQGTIRGMHFQTFPGQAKLVSVIQGTIFDVVVDIRRDSPTFGKWKGVYLDDKEYKQLFVPIGFAHGFCVVSHTAHVHYKVSSIYDPTHEKSFRFDDPNIGIIWPMQSAIVSEKDRLAPLFHEVCLK